MVLTPQLELLTVANSIGARLKLKATIIPSAKLVDDLLLIIHQKLSGVIVG